jgi:hypothetical protein
MIKPGRSIGRLQWPGATLALNRTISHLRTLPPQPQKRYLLIIKNGLVQHRDKIVDRFAITIYPCSLGGIVLMLAIAGNALSGLRRKPVPVI